MDTQAAAALEAADDTAKAYPLAEAEADRMVQPEDNHPDGNHRSSAAAAAAADQD